MMDRRLFIGLVSGAALTPHEAAFSQTAARRPIRHIRTNTLDIAYEESGPQTGFPVLLMHGFPYDPRAFDEVTPPLVMNGYRAIVPYLRGYGPTRFLSAATPRSGQQAALGTDLLALMDALKLPSAALAGYDWGGRAACVVAALWPERVRCLVSANGYTIQDIPASAMPATPEQEHRLWYQYYFHTERGRAGLQANRHDLCKLLWRLWSPNWAFDDATYERTAASFDNPDFVDVVIQSYRHRYGYAPGDPALEPIEQQLAKLPKIAAPTIVLQGEEDGVNSAAATDTQARYFTGRYQRRLLAKIGHNVPQEAPQAVAAALLDLLSTGPRAK
jgi:pimeloyl-ACP methyl ester carboxylesterase